MNRITKRCIGITLLLAIGLTAGLGIPVLFGYPFATVLENFKGVLIALSLGAGFITLLVLAIILIGL